MKIIYIVLIPLLTASPTSFAQSIIEAFTTSCAEVSDLVDGQGAPLDQNSICSGGGIIGTFAIGAFTFNNSLSPASNTSSAVLNSGINNAIQNTISTRLKNNHLGIDSPRVSSFQFNGQSLGGGASADNNLEKNWGVFGNIVYTDGERDNQSINGFSIDTGGNSSTSTDQLGFDYSGVDFIGGADYKFNKNIVIGATLSIGDQESKDNNSRSETESDQISVTAFSSLYLDNGIYIDALLGFRTGETKYTRELTYTANIDGNDEQFSTLARADTDSDSINLSIGTGTNFSHREWNFNPYLALNWQKTDIDSYRESATASGTFAAVEQVIINNFLLNVADQSIESLTSVMGINKSKAFNLRNSVVVPQLSLSWVHQFEDEEDISARFLFGNDQFVTETSELDADYFTLGISLTSTYTNNLVSYLQIEAFLGHSDIDQYAISAGIRKEL